MSSMISLASIVFSAYCLSSIHEQVESSRRNRIRNISEYVNMIRVILYIIDAI